MAQNTIDQVAVGIGIGIAILFGSQAGAILWGLLRGGFRCGGLSRTLSFWFDQTELEEFLKRFDQRVAQLGFVAAGSGIYEQDRVHGAELDSFTHAKTPKRLVLTLGAADANGRIPIQVTLRYMELIVADTGESAYRDAVLAYACGQIDEMSVVPHLSHAAMTGFIGSLLGLVTALIATTGGFSAWALGLGGVVVCEAFLCVAGLVASWRAPAEITGRGIALAGLLASFLAGGLVLLL